ncbi:MAG: sugar phosphate isomerase/epimerase [Rhizobiaceae bacterium]|nr:sugar phosphate isomerase/epimerase [Rhizobiaceae bacterium]
MLVGVDSTKFPGAASHDAGWLLEQAKREGLDGVFFRSVLELSPTLDRGQMLEVANHAASMGLRIEAGVGKVNPFSTPEMPAIRALGGGDYRQAMVRTIEAAAQAGIHDLWTALCNYQFDLAPRGIFAFDRFRTDVDWPEQLDATTTFLRALAPVLRDHGSRLNIETHEEITSFELVRIVEAVGPDVLGITFDTANVAVRGEEPVAAALRAAPYVRATHVRDMALLETSEGLARFLLPVGEGVIDWPALLGTLPDKTPDGREVMLSIEGILRGRGEMAIPYRDPRWLEGHPDLVGAELETLIGYAKSSRSPDLDTLRGPVVEGEPLDFIRRSAAALRRHLAAGRHAA